MVDTNRSFFVTEHVHFSPQTGQMVFCPELHRQIKSMTSKGFERAEVFLKLLPDGSLDPTEAMHLWWKEGDYGHQVS